MFLLPQSSNMVYKTDNREQIDLFYNCGDLDFHFELDQHFNGPAFNLQYTSESDPNC